MAEFSGPFNTQNFDEVYWREAFSSLWTNGVMAGGKISGTVVGDLGLSSPNSGMVTTLSAGLAIINGMSYRNDSNKTMTHSASDPSLPRIDYVVIKFDFAGRTIGAQVKTGTPNASPVAPSLTQNATTYELPIAQVRIDATVTAIATGKLTDARVYTQPNILGKTVGNNSGNIALANGTVVTNLNADKLDGLDQSAFVHATSGLSGKFTAASSPPGSPADGDLWLDTSVTL